LKTPRQADLEFSWVTRELGPQWEHWRAHATAWMATQQISFPHRLASLRNFFEEYLHRLNLPSDPAWLLNRRNAVPDFFEAACPKSLGGTSYNNTVREFLQWLLEERFSEPDDYGCPVLLPVYHNPVPRRSKRAFSRPDESVHSPLPYRFIRGLRQIFAPGRHFRDWTWAHAALGVADGSKGGAVVGDWFEVPEERIDREDPDCVWRRRETKERGGVLEIWSPVRSVALLVKLMLPPRTFQVRTLDSGEADTWRYTAAGWVRNTGRLAMGDERKPVRHGVFRRVQDHETGEVRTALYINTNKTADIGKEGDARGHVIPWEHHELLYWLEKLRNWQEKYNPIARPTPWKELQLKHIGHAHSAEQLARMPDTCFLFRHPCASPSETDKPLPSKSLDRLWSELLSELQRRCEARGETLPDGRPLKFVRSRKQAKDGYAALYPLHSLRVSLLTCLALDGEVPLPILSKLVAGHSRLLMTIYYTKPGVARMTQVLNEASAKLEASSAEGLQRFLSEATYEQLVKGAVYNSLEGMQAALPVRPEDRNPIGWMVRHHGICLVGGNTSPMEGNSRIGGCFNGGALLQRNNIDPTHNRYSPVPGGPGNCVRCRWFVTEPRFIDALRAHFNNVSYHLGEAARSAKAHEETLETLMANRAAAERTGRPFTAQNKLLRVERLWETALAKVDQLANDLTATYRLIKRCYDLVQQRNNDALGKQQLVAVGGLQDLRVAFDETKSELLPLAGVCADAEIYPDEDPGKAVVRRSQILDSALYREGVQPIFMTLSEEEQLRVGNRFMEDLHKLAQLDTPALGLESVVGVIESGRSLAELGLAADIKELLESQLKHPIASLSDLTVPPTSRLSDKHQ
jgi:hypothetical protein